MSRISPQHSTPADIVAARVVWFTGTRYSPTNKTFACVHSSTPLPTRDLPRGTVDLRGIHFGRFTVVGLSSQLRPSNSSRGAAWVVRCNCGNFAHRTAKAIRNPNNSTDSCEECRRRDAEARRFAQKDRFRKLSPVTRRPNVEPGPLPPVVPGNATVPHHHGAGIVRAATIADVLGKHRVPKRDRRKALLPLQSAAHPAGGSM